MSAASEVRCHADRDGDCYWSEWPASGRQPSEPLPARRARVRVLRTRRWAASGVMSERGWWAVSTEQNAVCSRAYDTARLQAQVIERQAARIAELEARLDASGGVS